MSIKSDRWIRRMAEEHGMIEPFEPGQVRENGAGRIVSFGTSSYGYDVRCAADFKVFTNIDSAVVDPKAFDETSFVDKRADVRSALDQAFAMKNRLVLLDFITDQTENVYPMIASGKGQHEMELSPHRELA